MFNFSRIRSEVANYTFADDKFCSEVCDKLFEINPEAQSLNDFERSVFYDVIFEVDVNNMF